MADTPAPPPASDEPMEEGKPAAGPGPEPAAAGGEAAAASAEAAGEEDAGVRLHISCKDFARTPGDKIQTWLSKTSACNLQKFFKVKQWGYAFVNVLPEEDAKFRAAIDGATYRSSSVQVKEGHARDANNRRPKGADSGEPNAKRQKKAGFPEGYVPTLKDIKDKEKGHKGAGVEKTVLQKAAPLLEYPYETQLKMKETYVKSAVRNFTKQVKQRVEMEGSQAQWATPEWSLTVKAPVGCGCPLDPIVGQPSDSLTGYRNKCEFTIGLGEDGEPQVGFVQRITAESGQLIGAPDDIPHVPAVMKQLCGAMRACVKASPFPIFDRRREKKTGIWRLVMVRLSSSGEMLVLVQTATLEEEKRKELVASVLDALKASDPPLNVVSLYLQLNDGVSDAAAPGCPLLHVHGKERLVMPLMGLNFEIGPLSFFQTNSKGCALLYERAITWARPEKALMLDICCGVGTIGLCCAQRCKKVVGIELIPEAVESAKQNAALNGIENASFFAGKAEDVLPEVLANELAEAGDECDVCAIVDPPRPGLHKDVLYALRDCERLSRIVYISCNPESLADDVVKLASPKDDNDHFVPVRAVAVDMFPHTVHCEMVLLLERKSKVKVPEVEVPAPSEVSAGLP